MLKALVESAGRFEELPAVGYEKRGIDWEVVLEREAGKARLSDFREAGVSKWAPVRGDRSGKASEDNVKAALLADKAEYALGLEGEAGANRESVKHREFKRLLSEAAGATGDWEVKRVWEFLEGYWARQDGELEKQVRASVKPGDFVAFRTGPAAPFPFEKAVIQGFWAGHLGRECWGSKTRGYCAICGKEGFIARILPWKVNLFKKYRCPISSFNEPAFTSWGKEQTENSPLCFECASTASRVLQYLVSSERHSRVLALDKSKGRGESPLRNELAVYWLKEGVRLEGAGEGGVIDFEAALGETLGEPEKRAGPPADPEQVKRLYGLPWSGAATGLNLERNRFYLAVLSPNKSRLVVREWIETAVKKVCARLRAYDEARTIISADGAKIVRPTVGEIMDSLRPWKSKGGEDANLVRALVRTAYLGVAPPWALLEGAVRRFRVREQAKNRAEEAELARRDEAQAAGIKIVLTFGRKEAENMQTLDCARASGPRLCGQLLAILEEAQGRASKWRVGARLVDRFYGGASTAPAATLGRLLNLATQAHLPKIRKAGAGCEEIEQAIEGVMAKLEESGGFPRTLTLREQGEFALGFYGQRAKFRAARPKPSAEVQDAGEAEGRTADVGSSL
jgi:CRISPR-associated protein Csd1